MNHCPRFLREALRKVAGGSHARRNRVKKRDLHGENEHFELDFNTAWPSAAVSQRFLSFPNYLSPGSVKPE